MWVFNSIFSSKYILFQPSHLSEESCKCMLEVNKEFNCLSLILVFITSIHVYYVHRFSPSLARTFWRRARARALNNVFNLIEIESNSGQRGEDYCPLDIGPIRIPVTPFFLHNIPKIFVFIHTNIRNNINITEFLS